RAAVSGAVPFVAPLIVAVVVGCIDCHSNAPRLADFNANALQIHTSRDHSLDRPRHVLLPKCGGSAPHMTTAKSAYERSSFEIVQAVAIGAECWPLVGGHLAPQELRKWAGVAGIGSRSATLNPGKIGKIGKIGRIAIICQWLGRSLVSYRFLTGLTAGKIAVRFIGKIHRR